MKLIKSSSFKTHGLYIEDSGYYFNNSIHIYGNNATETFNDINSVSNFVNERFKNILQKELVCVGQDLFGNQFVIENDLISFLNIESGELTEVCSDRRYLIDAIEKDFDYFTVRNISEKLSHTDIIQLANGFRFCPKFPFVLGGEYEFNNIYLKECFSNIDLNFSIAFQMHNLPDGTKVKIKIL